VQNSEIASIKSYFTIRKLSFLEISFIFSNCQLLPIVKKKEEMFMDLYLYVKKYLTKTNELIL
jgi:hypothetical protein